MHCICVSGRDYMLEDMAQMFVAGTLHRFSHPLNYMNHEGIYISTAWLPPFPPSSLPQNPLSSPPSFHMSSLIKDQRLITENTPNAPLLRWNLVNAPHPYKNAGYHAFFLMFPL